MLALSLFFAWNHTYGLLFHLQCGAILHWRLMFVGINKSTAKIACQEIPRYWLVMFSILIWLLKSLRKKCRYPSLNLWNPIPKSLNKKGIRVERDQGDVSCVNLCQGVNQGVGNDTHSSFYVTLLVNDLVFETHRIYKTAYLLGLIK